MNSRLIFQLLLVNLALIFSISHSAAAQLSDTFSVNGFGTLGVTKTTDPDMGFRTNISTDNVTNDEWNFASRSLAGVQFSAQWNDSWKSTVQLIQQKQADSTFSDQIQIATIDYMPTREWLIRLGRNAPRIYMLTDTRNVGYGYLWTHPPIEFYGQLQSNYIDGILASYTHPIGADTLTTTFGVGQSGLQNAYPNSIFTADFSRSMAVSMEYEHEAWLFRGSVSAVKNSNQWATLLRDYLDRYSVAFPGAAILSNELDTANTHILFYSLGAAYNDDRWAIQSELGHVNSDNDIVPDSFAGYLSIGHHFGNITPYIMYSKIKTTSTDVNVPADVDYYSQYDSQLNYLAQRSLSYLNSQFDQSGIALGVRWDINSKFAIKTQWDRKYINADGNHLWWNIHDSSKKMIDVFSLNLDFVF